jgi:hypothetical protein
MGSCRGSGVRCMVTARLWRYRDLNVGRTWTYDLTDPDAGPGISCESVGRLFPREAVLERECQISDG